MEQTVVGDARAAVETARFRHAVSLSAHRTVVVTIAIGGERFELSAGSVAALSSEPATVMVSLDRSAPNLEEVASAGTFAVNVLGDRRRLAEELGAAGDVTTREVRVHTGRGGLPLLRDALAHLECEVVELLTGATQVLLVGRVLAVGHCAAGTKPGLERFDFTHEDEVYEQVRDRLVARVYAPNEVIALEDLAFELGADQSAGRYALTRLASDGYVRRDPDLGYVVTQLDQRTADETFEGMLGLELAAIELTLGRTSFEDLAELRERFEQMAGLPSGGRWIDLGAYFEASYAFHQCLVAASRNTTLVAAFADLGTKTLMTRGFGFSPATAHELIEVQRRLLEGFECGDGAAARSAAREYSAIAKQRVRAILQHTGGRL